MGCSTGMSLWISWAKSISTLRMQKEAAVSVLEQNSEELIPRTVIKVEKVSAGAL